MTAPFASGVYLLGEITLRPFQPGDAELAARCLVTMEPWHTLGSSTTGLMKYFVQPDEGLRRFVIEKAGEPAGWLSIRHPWLRGPFIEVLAIHPRFQGQHLGRRVVEWVREESPPTCHNCWSTVSSFNLSARKFYHHLDFKEIAPLPDLVTKGHEEILLRRRY